MQLLSEWIGDRGADVLCTEEPGGTQLGRELRTIILHGEDIDPRTEALLYAADRAHHIDTVVRPALEAGRIVVSDRYLDSSVAYQGVGRGLGAQWIEQLNLWGAHGLKPDVTILLDLDPRQLPERITRSLDRLERAGAQFHATTREAFLARARAEPERFVVVDAAPGVEEVAAQVRRAVAAKLGWQE